MDDSILMNRFREGDKEAFRVTYDGIVRHLHAYIYDKIKAYKVESRIDTDDVCVEVFYRLFKNKEKIKTMGHLRGVCFSTEKNYLIDFAYKSASRFFISAADPNIYYEHDHCVAPTESTKDLKESRRLIENAIARLPKMRKAVIIDIFVNEMSSFEIADKYGLSPQTVLNHKTKTIYDLREALLPYKEYILI